MHAAPGDEGALVNGDNLSHSRCQAERKDLREELGQEVDQADWSVVRERGGVRFLRQQGEQGLIKLVESTPVHGVEFVERGANIRLDDRPTGA